MINARWEHIKIQLLETQSFSRRFVRNPIESMRSLPVLDWPVLLGLHSAIAASCGILGGLIERNWLGAIASLLVAPLAALILTFLFSGIFYYVIQFAFGKTPDFYRLVQNVVFAVIPSQVLGIISGLVPPIFLLGVAATLMLLYVGLVSNLGLEAKKLKNIFLSLFAVVAVYWVVQLVSMSSSSNRIRLKATPESLDILEKEMQSED